ncbi:hypothetical protein PV646_36265 [Streptomyces sp. ID05-26A]|nr:hypothetical protein [Streptomyces sp. ID05-26A]
MSDLSTLDDAFAELERRIDTAATGMAPVVRPRRAVRLVPVAATVVAVAGLFAGAMWLVPGDAGTPAAGPPPTAPSTTMTRVPAPTSPEDLTTRFRVVLGDTATVEVTAGHVLGSPPPSKNLEPTGTGVTPQRWDPDAATHALIGGTLTSAGVTGSFSLTIKAGDDSEPGTWCRNSHPVDCVVSTLPDGSQLATETARLAPGAVSYMVCAKRPDGTMVRLQVGNQEDPAGAAIGSPGGRFLSPQPPLTLEQLKAIATSDKW